MGCSPRGAAQPSRDGHSGEYGPLQSGEASRNEGAGLLDAWTKGVEDTRCVEDANEAINVPAVSRDNNQITVKKQTTKEAAVAEWATADIPRSKLREGVVDERCK